MATNRDMQAFVAAYEEAWASRVPGAMRALWHPDGVLYDPTLGRAVSGEVVPYNNDSTKSAIPDFSWHLTRWAHVRDAAFLEWCCRDRVGLPDPQSSAPC